jgi:hypothetical protein
MIASYAKHGLTPTINSLGSTPPNQILYIGLSSNFSEMNWLDLLKEFAGFEGCKFYSTYALAKFSSIENATQCMDKLGSESNLSLSFSKIKVGVDSAIESNTNTDSLSRITSSFPAPKKTIHVTNLDRDRSLFLKMLLSFDGFDRVAFYNDYSFVCFDEIQNAALAMEKLMSKTKMKASFAKVDFIHHSVAPSQIGTINSILKISDFPTNMIQSELVGIFQTLDGFVNATHFYASGCLAYFSTPELAHKALERINHFTNLTAVYSTKGLKETDTKRIKPLKFPLDLPALCPLPIKPRSRSESASLDSDHFVADAMAEIKNLKNLSNAADQSKFTNLFSQPDYNSKSLSESQGNPAQASASSINSTNTDVTFRESIDLLQETSPSLLSQDKSFQVSPPTEPVYSFEKYSYQDMYRQASDAKNLLNCLLNRLQFLEQENAFLKESLRRVAATTDPDMTFSRSASVGFPMEHSNWDFQNPSLLHEKAKGSGQNVSMLHGLLAMCD